MDSQPAEKKSVRITVYNQTVTLSTTGDPRELEESGRLVDDLVSSIVARTGTADIGRANLLACVHLADQLRAVERQLEEIRNRVTAKTAEFCAMLDEVVEP